MRRVKGDIDGRDHFQRWTVGGVFWNEETDQTSDMASGGVCQDPRTDRPA